MYVLPSAVLVLCVGAVPFVLDTLGFDWMTGLVVPRASLLLLLARSLSALLYSPTGWSEDDHYPAINMATLLVEGRLLGHEYTVGTRLNSPYGPI